MKKASSSLELYYYITVVHPMLWIPHKYTSLSFALTVPGCGFDPISCQESMECQDALWAVLFFMISITYTTYFQLFDINPVNSCLM